MIIMNITLGQMSWLVLHLWKELEILYDFLVCIAEPLFWSLKHPKLQKKPSFPRMPNFSSCSGNRCKCRLFMGNRQKSNHGSWNVLEVRNTKHNRDTVSRQRIWDFNRDSNQEGNTEQESVINRIACDRVMWCGRSPRQPYCEVVTNSWLFGWQPTVSIKMTHWEELL